VDAIKVSEEVVQPVGAVWPVDKSVFQGTEPAGAQMKGSVQRSLLEVLHVVVGDDRRHVSRAGYRS
jgi:hypothetical protein